MCLLGSPPRSLVIKGSSDSPPYVSLRFLLAFLLSGVQRSPICLLGSPSRSLVIRGPVISPVSPWVPISLSVLPLRVQRFSSEYLLAFPPRSLAVRGPGISSPSSPCPPPPPPHCEAISSSVSLLVSTALSCRQGSRSPSGRFLVSPSPSCRHAGVQRSPPYLLGFPPHFLAARAPAHGPQLEWMSAATSVQTSPFISLCGRSTPRLRYGLHNVEFHARALVWPVESQHRSIHSLVRKQLQRLT